ncbi:RagB/SusD family nutrient uptake outer membrane protein [Olivibacter domesticus]|uniref:Starch-binding associating with outer membrane n=1 Tax=Olivibacter domesticus TaxID=407022 RepID=A0A1H7IIY1_OLID1|nr:RagB/SusD family nutrient uptake outer membrane protein [Olivibacter domesticus]SEK61520.1 Starch-binding associating with outer membrane [Olivibacter domesticus]
MTQLNKVYRRYKAKLLKYISSSKQAYSFWTLFNYYSGSDLYIIVSFLFLSIIISSCDKLIEVNPPVTNINSENVFNSDDSAIGAVTGIYAKLSSESFHSRDLTSTSFILGLTSDELTLDNSISDETYLSYYQNSLTSAIFSVGNQDLWSKIYPIIYKANAAIEGLEKSSLLTSKVKDQLMGEVKFIRAFCYFYLVNLYGDVPKILSTTYTQNTNIPRTLKSDIWAQIIQDLIDAKSLMVDDYLDASLTFPSTERVRPSKFAATALLARSYLYMTEWQKADAEASEIISHSERFTLSPLSDVFLANSSEAIWQLQPVSSHSTEDGRFFIIPETGPSGDWPVYLNRSLLNSIESIDQREILWINKIVANGQSYYYPSKYKNNQTYDGPISEYSMVLRLGEQILIRAEARAHEGNLSGAIADLNNIRSRAGLKSTNATTQDELINAILQERRIELFSEWGHRWLDLKRTNTINTVMEFETARKGGLWSSHSQLFPISASEIISNPSLIQNDGY